MPLSETLAASPPELQSLVAAVQARLGLRLRPALASELAEKLAALVSSGQVASLHELSERFRKAARGDGLVQAVIDAASICETSFFRAPEQLQRIEELFVRHILPSRHAQPGIPLRVWSAACSTGEEAYTLAIVLSRIAPGLQLEVLGTDMNAAALELAREGFYRPRAVRAVPPKLLSTFFTPEGEGFRVNAALRARVRFEKLNLVTDPYPDPLRDVHGFDLVLCRNVLIYLDPVHVPSVLRNLERTLNPVALLALSSAEYSAAKHARGLKDLTGGLLLRAPSMWE